MDRDGGNPVPLEASSWEICSIAEVMGCWDLVPSVYLRLEDSNTPVPISCPHFQEWNLLCQLPPMAWNGIDP